MFHCDAATLAVLQTTFVAYILSVTSPGPNVFLMLRAAAVERNYVNVFALGMGLATGTAIWLVLTYLGLTALIHEFKGALSVIQLIGIAYFAYLGASLLLPKKEESTPRAGKKQRSAAKSPLANYLTGILVNLSNPRTALFFLTLFGPVMAKLQTGPLLVAVYAAIFGLACCWQLLLSAFFFLKGMKLRVNIQGQLIRYALSVSFFVIAYHMAVNALSS